MSKVMWLQSIDGDVPTIDLDHTELHALRLVLDTYIVYISERSDINMVGFVRELREQLK